MYLNDSYQVFKDDILLGTFEDGIGYRFDDDATKIYQEYYSDSAEKKMKVKIINKNGNKIFFVQALNKNNGWDTLFNDRAVL